MRFVIRPQQKMAPVKKSALTAVIFCFMLCSHGAEAGWMTTALYGVAATAAVGVGGPAALAAIGFKAGGVAAGSYAASMMSASAIASGGGVAAGGVVATCQSLAMGGIPAIASASAGVATSAMKIAADYMTKK